MSCFEMTALSRDNKWFRFNLSDVPVTFTNEEFALLAKPNTPRLFLNTIRRGEKETGLFEGDIIQCDGENWLVCYERGFYAINSSYTSRYLNQLDGYEYLGTYKDIGFPIALTERMKHLFKYKDCVFRINDIIGTYKGGLILRSVSLPIPIEEIHQECCITRNKTRLYLEDKIDGGIIKLYLGRIALYKDGVYTDLATGGVL